MQQYLISRFVHMAFSHGIYGFYLKTALISIRKILFLYFEIFRTSLDIQNGSTLDDGFEIVMCLLFVSI